MGLCNKAAVGVPNSLLCLSNNCCIGATFGTMGERFDKLFKRKVYVHHYAQFMEAEGMALARRNVLDLQNAYADLQNAAPPDFARDTPASGDSFI